MEIGFISILALGFILGIKHAIEPDHVIAVSTIASQSKKLTKSSLAGVFWGIGHTATLFIVGIIIILMKGTISETWAMSLEFLVGIMLVYFGFIAIVSYKKMNQSKKTAMKDVNNKGFYLKSTIIGLIHGLAGSAAMVLLTLSTVHNIWQGAMYILVFGAGTVIGMLLFTTILGIPFVLSTNKLRLNKVFTQITGLISIAFGFYYMYSLAITEGLLKLWVQ